MKKRKLLSLLLAAALVFAAAACANGGGGTATTGTNAPTATSAPAADASPAVSDGVDREHYTFDYYYNYDWQGLKPWAADLTSKHWGEIFNIHVNFSKPDSNAEEQLNLRISSNDLPDAIWMDRGAMNIRVARMGLFVDLDTLKPQLPNNWYDDNILQQTQNHLKIDGKLYGIPNWARKDASGGNNCWMYTEEIYKAAGSPTITTFDDLYNYAINVRDNVPKTSEGLDVIPMIVEDTGGTGLQFVRAIYRSLGAPYDEGGHYGRVGNDFKPLVYDPLYQEALLEANKWFREELISPTTFGDSQDQFLEKVTSARVGLMWYDHSQDDGKNFRRTLRQAYPGNSIEVIQFEAEGMTRLYPPANGISPGKIYGEHYSTIGWNVSCIFTKAEKPLRIFEWISYLLTKEGSIEMMYGPPGTDVWDTKDANGNPILKNNPDFLDVEYVQDTLALWHWAIAGHADNVDHTKFAANDALPEDQRSWVISHQAHRFTPLMRPLTDEFLNIGNSIEPDTDLAVKRTICEEYLDTQILRIIMAGSSAEAQSMINDAIAYIEANGMLEIMPVYNAVYQDNLAKQGGTIFTR